MSRGMSGLRPLVPLKPVDILLVTALGRIDAGKNDNTYSNERNMLPAARHPQPKGAKRIPMIQGDRPVIEFWGTILGAGSVRCRCAARGDRVGGVKRLS